MKRTLAQIIDDWFKNSPDWPFPIDDPAAETRRFLDACRCDGDDMEHQHDDVLAAIKTFIAEWDKEAITTE